MTWPPVLPPSDVTDLLDRDDGYHAALNNVAATALEDVTHHFSGVRVGQYLGTTDADGLIVVPFDRTYIAEPVPVPIIVSTSTESHFVQIHEVTVSGFTVRAFFGAANTLYPAGYNLWIAYFVVGELA
jgi:hypothetical protein